MESVAAETKLQYKKFISQIKRMARNISFNLVLQISTTAVVGTESMPPVRMDCIWILMLGMAMV